MSDGDRDATDELIQLAGERGDMASCAVWRIRATRPPPMS